MIPFREHLLERIFRSGVTSAGQASYILERIFRSGISPADPASYILERIFRSRASEGQEYPDPRQTNLDSGGHENLDLESRKPASKGCPIACR